MITNEEVQKLIDDVIDSYEIQIQILRDDLESRIVDLENRVYNLEP